MNEYDTAQWLQDGEISFKVQLPSVLYDLLRDSHCYFMVPLYLGLFKA